MQSLKLLRIAIIHVVVAASINSGNILIYIRSISLFKKYHLRKSIIFQTSISIPVQPHPPPPLPYQSSSGYVQVKTHTPPVVPRKSSSASALSQNSAPPPSPHRSKSGFSPAQPPPLPPRGSGPARPRPPVPPPQIYSRTTQSPHSDGQGKLFSNFPSQSFMLH